MKLIRIPYVPIMNKPAVNVFQFVSFRTWMRTLNLEFGVDYTATWMSASKELHVILSDENDAMFSYIELVLLEKPWEEYD